MTPQELKQHRIQLFRDCAAWRKPERVPFLANIVTWKIIDSGYKFSEALHDYDIMSKCVTNFLDKYNVDVLTDTGVRNPMRIPESIGESYYYVNDEAEALGVHAYSLCEKQELAELAQDTDKFVWEKMLPRKFPNFQHLKKEDFQRALDEQLAFNNYTAGITKVVREQYGLPALTSLKCGFPNAGVEEMFSMVRGIRGLSLDMRRNPDDLLACIHAYEKKTLDPVIEKVYASEDGPDPDACFDLGIMLLAHTVMSESQWEKFYWPSLKRLLDAAAAKKKSVRLTVEGSLSRFFRYFADYPKGVVTLNLDQGRRGGSPSGAAKLLHRRWPDRRHVGAGYTSGLHRQTGVPVRCHGRQKRRFHPDHGQVHLLPQRREARESESRVRLRHVLPVLILFPD